MLFRSSRCSRRSRSTERRLAAAQLQPGPLRPVDPVRHVEHLEPLLDVDRQHLVRLVPYPVDLVIAVCNYAAFTIMALRGYNQDAGADMQIRERYLTAIQWFESVERQRIHPAVVQTPIAAPKYQFPQVATGPLRGW